jgi:hypothetical protein
LRPAAARLGGRSGQQQHAAEVLLAGRRVDLGGQQDGQHRGGDEDGEAEPQDHAGPSWAMPAAIPPPTAAPTTLAIEIRELALTRVKFSGSSRGTADAWVTRNALEATRQPSAAGTARTSCPAHRPAPSTGTPGGQGGSDRPAPAVPEAVEERPDQRRDDGERGHGQQQELGDLGPGLVGGQGEEQGAGQRDGDAASPAAARNCTWVRRASPLSPAPPEIV